MGFSSSIALDTLYPVGSFYYTTAAECPIAALGVGTWVNVGTSLIMTVNNTASVVGNGYAIGLSNGSNNRTLQDWSGGANFPFIGGQNRPTGKLPQTGAGNNAGTGNVLGLSTNPNNSGIIANINRSILTLNIFQRQA